MSQIEEAAAQTRLRTGSSNGIGGLALSYGKLLQRHRSANAAHCVLNKSTSVDGWHA